MIIKYKAFASIKDKECGWKRITESLHETEVEAKKAALHLAESYTECETGIHKYYILTKEEWRNEYYKDISIEDGKTKVWMINENDGNGCKLIYEGMHFEIL